MADGYRLEIEAHLSDEESRRELDKLVAFTAKQGQKLENSLRITADVTITKAEQDIKKLQNKKVKDININADVDTVKGQTALQEFIARNDAQSIDTDVDLDATKAVTEHDAFIAKASAKKIHTRVEVDGRGMQAIATELTTATRAAEQLTGRLGTVAITAGGAGLAIAGIATAALGAVGLGAASTIEKSQLSLQTLIGDVPKANNLLKVFKKEADISPFELKDYAITAAKFASATDDVNEIRERTLQAAKTSAQYGGDLALVGKALADVSNKGKLAGQEVIQFANAGIPIQGMIARFLILNGTLKKMPLDKAIVEVQKLQEEGKLTADVVRGAIDAALDPKISEKFSKTLTGRLSTLKDAFKTTAAAFVGVDISNFTGETIVNPGGFYDTLGKSVSSLADTFNSANFKDALGEAGTALGVGFAAFAKHLPTVVELMAQFFAISARVVGKMFELSGQLLDTFGPGLISGMKSAADHSETIAKVLGGLVVGGIGLKLASVFIGIVTPIFNLLPMIAKLGGLFSGLGGAISSFGTYFAVLSAEGVGFFGSVSTAAATVLGPIGLIVVAVVAVGAAMTSAYVKSKELRDGLVAGLKLIRQGAKVVVDGFKEIASAIWSILQPIGEALAPIFNGFVVAGGLVLIVIGGIAKAFGAVLKVVAPIIGFLAKMAIVLSPIGIAIALIRAAWDRWGEGIKTVGKAIGEFFKAVIKVIESVANAVKTAVGFVASIASKIPVVGGAFKEANKEINNTGKEVKEVEKKFGTFSNLSQAEVDKIKERVSSLRQGILDTLKVNDTGILSPESVQEATKNVETALAKMQQKIADIQLLNEKGYGSLVVTAGEKGGEIGDALITKLAEQVRTGNEVPLQEMVAALAKLEAAKKLAEKEADKIVKQYEQDQIAKESARKVLAQEKERAEKRLEARKKQEKKLADAVIKAQEEGSKDILKNKKKLSDKEKKEIENYLYPNGSISTPEKPKPRKFNNDPKKVTQSPTTTTAPGGGGATLGVVSFAAQGAQLGGSLISGISNFFKGKDIFGSIKDTVSGAAGGLGSFFTETVFPLGGKLVNGLKSGISNAVSSAGDFLGGVRTSMATGFGNVLSSIGGFISNVGGKAGQAFNSARSVGSSIVSGITSGLSSAGSSITSALTGALRTGWNNMKNLVSGVWGQTKSIFAGLPGKFKISLPNFSIPGLAVGTTNFQGGLARVGERGPENVFLPKGTRVDPAHKSRENKSAPVIHNYYSTINGVSMEQAVAEWEAKIRAQRRRVNA